MDRGRDRIRERYRDSDRDRGRDRGRGQRIGQGKGQKQGHSWYRRAGHYLHSSEPPALHRLLVQVRTQKKKVIF